MSIVLLFYTSFFCLLTGQNIRLEPVTAPGILLLVLNIMCASLNIIRGVHLIEYTFQVRATHTFKFFIFNMLFKVIRQPSYSHHKAGCYD